MTEQRLKDIQNTTSNERTEAEKLPEQHPKALTEDLDGNYPKLMRFLRSIKDSMTFDDPSGAVKKIQNSASPASQTHGENSDTTKSNGSPSSLMSLLCKIKKSMSFSDPSGTLKTSDPISDPSVQTQHSSNEAAQQVESKQPAEQDEIPQLKSRKDLIEEQDIAFMSSLSQAALEKPTAKSQWVVWIILLVVIWLISWANYAELDKIIRGDGKVVPSTKIQVIQNLEGGIVEQMFIHTGDSVKKGQTIIKLDNTQFSSSFDESEIKEAQLAAQAQRLKAEAFQKPFRAKKASTNPRIQALYDREYALYQARRKQHKTNDAIIVEQIEQKKLELKEAQNQAKQLTRSLELLRQEVNLTQPLVRQGIASQVDLLKLQREENDALSKLRTVQYSIPKIKSVITEYRSKRIEFKEVFMNEAHEELNQVLAEISQLEKSKMALADRVKRTDIKSPVNGTIKQIFVNTIGGVVQPGSDIVEIVPDDDALVLETKILPADIGFIYKGLKAKVKFTAYDFAIYGGLDGTVTQISADTITDEEGNSFYIARIKTDKNHLGAATSPLYLLPGMTASVDVIVGKHTLLDYLLKPIIKARDLALRES